MLLRDWLAAWRTTSIGSHLTSNQAPRRTRIRRTNRPSLPVETLESRTLPSAYSWSAVAWESSPLNGRDAGTAAQPTLQDLDNDGDLDNLAGNGLGQFSYYRNNGTPSAPVFPTQSTVTSGATINPLRNVDIGDGSMLAWGDLDGDLDLDLLVSNQQGIFSYYRNTGSVSSITLTAQTGTNNPMNGVDVGTNGAPTLGDLDGDGDLDMIVGIIDTTDGNIGKFKYYRNTGSTSAPAFTEMTGSDNPLSGLTYGAFSVPKPQLYNLDADSDLDLVIGLDTGMLAYFKNTGTTSAPVFTEQTGSANPWNGIAFVGNPSFASSNAAPAFGDLDDDGDPDLLVGLGNGTFSYYLAAPLPTGADLQLSQTVDAPSPGPGTTVTFTVTITNNGPLAATNITVANADPAGLTGLTFTPSAGTYSAGVWSIANLASSGTATLTVTGTIAAAGSDVSNSAEVTAVDQTDPDSTPNNHLSSEDDQVTSSFHVNANPVLTVSGAATLDTISANIPNNLNNGTLISTIISRLTPGGITDPDSGALQGIAVNGTTGNATGTWQYTINGGTNWLDVGTANNDSARLLAANPNTRIRYVPNAGFKGQAKIAFTAWDQTAGTNGGTGVTKFRTGSSPFSLAYDLAAISVVNVAPELNAGGTPTLTPISVNIPAANNPGTLLSDILNSMAPGGGITDGDTGAVRGIAVNGLTGLANGSWQYTINGGTNWTTFDTTGNSNARLLAADANTRIRFLPNPGFKGTASFAFVAWDRTAGSVGGTANVGTRGGSTPYSSTYEYATVSVTNIAPVLTPSKSSYLNPITNPNFDNPGTLVSDLISRMGPGGSITDVDPGTQLGIAVVGLLNQSDGTWEFSTNGGSLWAPVAATGTINARLLAPTARVRFIPNSGFRGTVQFAFVGWDQTAGTNGSLINAGSRGGSTAWSPLWDYARLEITPLD